jgi:uncharacterized protein YceK
MTSKTELKWLGKLALLLATTSLTGCATVSSEVPASRYPNNGVLHLKAGDTYTATETETWYSLTRYQACERDAINAAAALKQIKNR